MKNKGPLYVLTCYVIWGLLPIFWKLLAQVDSSVGGKVAVDLEHGKNLAGAFWQPRLVLMDPEVLDTLPLPVFMEGMAAASRTRPFSTSWRPGPPGRS